MLISANTAELAILFARIRIPIPIPAQYFWHIIGGLVVIVVLLFAVQVIWTFVVQGIWTEIRAWVAGRPAKKKSDSLHHDFHQAMRRVMILMMIADGNLEDSEIETIHKVYEAFAKTRLTFDEIRTEARSLEAEGMEIRQAVEGVALRLTNDGKSLLLRAAMMVVASDGVLQEGEKERLSELAHALQMSQHQFTQVFAQFTEPPREGGT